MKYFEFFFLQWHLIIILCKLIIISVNYETRKKSAFYETLCNGRIPWKSLSGSDWNLASITKGHPSPNFDLGEDENNIERRKTKPPITNLWAANQYGETLYRNGVTLSSASYNVSYCLYYAGESSFEVKIEADTSDVTDQPCNDKTRTYFCTVSDKQFTTKKHLKQRKQTHPGNKLYSCTQCEKLFATKYYLKQHMNVHSSKYKCTECGKCFSNNRELTVHRRSHSGEKPFECTVCSKRFTQSFNLARHSRIHSGEKPFICPECDKAFSENGDLTRHMRVHTGDKPYKCSLCDKSFSDSRNLQRHKRLVHSNRRPYDCRYCGKMFKSSHHLKHHVYTHTGAKPYSCRHCSDCFRRHHHLKAHLLKSHNEGAWFTCHICQKKFSHSGCLKRHLLRHEGVKPYVCDACSKSFCTEFELRSHQLKHSDYKQFCCGSCGKYFKYKCNVVYHFKKCSVKLGYVNIFARQDWEREQTISGQLLVGQSCYCWLKTCQWGHSVYPVVGDWIVVVFELDSVVVDWILV